MYPSAQWDISFMTDSRPHCLTIYTQKSIWMDTSNLDTTIHLPPPWSLLFPVFVLVYPQSILLLDNVRLHYSFPMLLMTMVVVVMSFVLMLESQNAEQHEQVQNTSQQ